MNKLVKKHILIINVLVVAITILFAACSSNPASNIKEPTPQAPIAGTAQQQATFQQVFNESYARDSVWAVAFENAFSSAFGQDSLKKFMDRKTLPHIAYSEDHEIKGTMRGDIAVNHGVTLTVSGIVYGGISIKKGGKLINNGAIYGNVENAYGEYIENGILQGALVTR